MSKRVRGITIEIGGDTSKLGQALKQTEDSISSVSKELKQVEYGLKFEPGNLELLGQKAELSAKMVELTAEKLNVLKDAQEQVSEQAKNGDIGADQYRAFQRELVATENKLGGYKKAVEDSSGKIKNNKRYLKELTAETENATNKTSIFGDVLKANLATEAIKIGLSGLSSAIAGIGSAVVEAGQMLVDFSKSSAAASDAIDKGSQAIGVSRQRFQEWSYMAEQNGASVDSIAYGMRRLQNSMADVDGEGGKVFKSLKQVGLSFDELSSMSPEDAMETVIKAFNEMPEGANKAALAFDIFGRQGQALMPMLNQSSEELELLRDRAHELGLVMEDEAIDAGLAFGDTMTDLTKTISGLSNNIGGLLLPSLTALAGTGTDLVSRFSRALREAGSNPAKIAEAINDGLQSVLDVVNDKLPVLIEKASNMITPIIEGIASNLPNLAEGVRQIIDTIGMVILDNLPMLLEVGFSIISMLADGVVASLPAIMEIGSQLIFMLIGKIVEMLPELTSAAIIIISQLAEGLTQALPQLIPAVINAVFKIVETLISNIDMLIDAGAQLILGLVTGIAEALPVLIEKAPEIIATLFIALLQAAPQLLDAGLEIINQVLNGIGNAFRMLRDMGDRIRNTILNAIIGNGRSIREVGIDIVKKLWEGILSVAKWIWERVSNLFNSIIRGTSIVEDAVDVGVQVGEALSDSIANTVARNSRINATAFESVGRNAGSDIARGFERADPGGIAGTNISRGITAGARSGASNAQRETEQLARDIERTTSNLLREIENQTNAYGEAITEALRRSKRIEIDTRKEAVQQQIDLLSDVSFREITTNEDISARKIQLLDDEYISRIRNIDEGLAAFLTSSNKEIQRHIDIIALTDQRAAIQLQANQDRITAIEEEARREREFIEERANNERRAEHERRIAQAQTDEARERAIFELGRFEEDLLRRSRERERAEQTRHLQEQSREILDRARRTAEEQAQIIADMRYEQQGQIYSLAYSLKSGEFDEPSPRQSLRSLEEQYEAFAETAAQLAVKLVEAGEEGQIEALKILEEFYPEWNRTGKRFVDKLSEGFRENMVKAVNDAVNIGVESARGVARGIDDNAHLAQQAARRLADLVQEEMRLALDINSPSGVGIWIGQMTGRGLCIGLESMIPTAERAAYKLGIAATPTSSGGGARYNPQAASSINVAINNNVTGNASHEALWELDRLNRKAIRQVANTLFAV